MPISRKKPAVASKAKAKVDVSVNRLGGSSGSIMKTARRVAKEQAEEAQKRRTGGDAAKYRFFVERGCEKEIIILDKSIEKAWGMWEHTIRGRDGKFNRHVPCVKDFANCPICAQGDRSYYAIFLTVLDLTPWETKEGKEVAHSKRLMCIKPNQLDALARIEEACIEKHGTFRGCYILMARGEGEKTAAVGEPVPQKGAKLFQWLDEDELVADYGHEAVLDKKTKEVYKQEDEDIRPFNYKKIFPEPDIEALEEEFGDPDAPPAGSRRQSRRGRKEEEYDEDEEKDEAPARSKRSPSRNDEPDEDEEEAETPKAKSRKHKFDEDEDDDEPVVKKRRKAVVEDDAEDDDEPVTKKKARRAPVEDDDEEEEQPRIIKRKRTPVVEDDEDANEDDEVPVRKKTLRKKAVIEDDDEDDDDEPVVKRKRSAVEEEPRKIKLKGKVKPGRRRASDPFEDEDEE